MLMPRLRAILRSSPNRSERTLVSRTRALTQSQRGQWVLIEVEAIDHGVRLRVALGQGLEFKASFHQSQERRELVLCVADKPRFCIGGNNQEGHAGPEAILIQ